MAPIHNSKPRFSKQILGPAAATLAFGMNCWALPTTYTWDNPNNDNFWPVSTNWDPIGLPTTSDIAIIDEIAPENQPRIGFPDQSNNIANVGTLRITTPSEDDSRTYTSLIAGTPDGVTHLNSILNFGTSGRIELERCAVGLINFFKIGTKDLLAITNPGSITLSVAGGQELQVVSRITGVGSLLIERHTTSGSARVTLGDPGTFSTFTGGVRVNGGTLNTATLALIGNSNPTDGGVLGKGTFWMDGGTVLVDEMLSSSVANPFVLERDAFAFVGNIGELSFNGTMTFASKQLTKQGSGTLVMNHALFADAGTLALSSGAVRFHYNSAGSWVGNGTSTFGAVRVGTSGTLAGTVVKTGTAEFAASYFRAGSMNIQSGTLSVSASGSGTLDPVGSTSGTSRVNSLSIAGGTSPTARLDLGNNDMVIDYSGTSPLGIGSTSLTSVIFKQVQSGYAAGSWTGPGITASVAANAGSTTYGLGFAEASDVLSFGTLSTLNWSGQTVDQTSVLLIMTWLGDATADGAVDISDFSRVSTNFNTAQTWANGDFDYNGFTDVNDFAFLAANYNQGGLLRGINPLESLYVAMLDFPNLYHEARLRPDIWWRFEEFELRGLGTIPPVPAYLVARGVPEPAAWGLFSGFLIARMMHRRSRMGSRVISSFERL